MIDWNKRNGGFLAPENVYEDQLSNLSMQINQLEKQLNKQKEILNKIKEILEEGYKRKDGFLELNEWQTRDLKRLLEEIK